MNCTCVRYTDLPHTSKLFADFTYHPDRIRSFYPHLPSDPGVYEAAAREMQFPPEGDRRRYTPMNLPLVGSIIPTRPPIPTRRLPRTPLVGFIRGTIV